MNEREQTQPRMTTAQYDRLVALLARIKYQHTVTVDGVACNDFTHGALTDARFVVHRLMLTTAERMVRKGFASQRELREQATAVLALPAERLPYVSPVHFGFQWTIAAVSDLTNAEADELKTLSALELEDARGSNYGAW